MKYSLKNAADSLGIKVSTAKVIFRNFQKEGRIGKKETRKKRLTKLKNNSNDSKSKIEVTELVYSK